MNMETVVDGMDSDMSGKRHGGGDGYTEEEAERSENKDTTSVCGSVIW